MYLDLCTYLHMYRSMYTYVNMCMYMYMCICMCIYIQDICTRRRSHARSACNGKAQSFWVTHVFDKRHSTRKPARQWRTHGDSKKRMPKKRLRIGAHIYIYRYIWMYVYEYVYVYVHVYAKVYMCMFMHTRKCTRRRTSLKAWCLLDT